MREVATASFGNPVKGPIRPPGSPFIRGNFRVTARFGQLDASHPTPHKGVDIGNGLCGEPILALADGSVSLAGLLGSAKVIRIKHRQFGDFESGYAHLATIEVKLGQKVIRGQRIGTLGKTGAAACHLHLGMKHNRTEIDGWPLLDQNREGEMLQGTNPVRVDNRRGLVLLDHTRFRSSPFVLAENVLVEFPHDAEIVPAFVVDGAVASGSVKWYGAWGATPRGREFGYIHVTTVGPLEPIEHP
jgi:murein DD-endopeptidase MepM/ murein hydrolase activator NlpD